MVLGMTHACADPAVETSLCDRVHRSVMEIQRLFSYVVASLSYQHALLSGTGNRGARVRNEWT